ncbi:uncharacterized protein [Amphiura filiformis]|uniref:uncharacterized protein n=1 Tax=Amphiura filiformis TaxID=82378 RepID=UPI003B213EFC
MESFGRHVRIQIQEGDITNEDTEALVRFIYPGADDLDGLLDAAGDIVRQEYVQAKARGGVICTSAGNIGQHKRLFHVEVRLDKSPVKFITALHTTLMSADEQDLRSIAIPGLALCPDKFLSAFMGVVYDFEDCEDPRCLRLIKTVIPAERAVEMIQMTKYIDISKQKMKNSYFYNGDQQDERAPLELENTDELSELNDTHHVVGSGIECHPLQAQKQERSSGTDIRKQDISPGTHTIATEESNSISEQTTFSSTFDETGIISLESSSKPVVLSDNINDAFSSTDATNNFSLTQPLNTTAQNGKMRTMNAFGRHVRIQIQEGDITNEDTESLVRFIFPGADDLDGLLDAAGDLVRQEYVQEKAKGGLYVNRGVVCTSAGNIGQVKRLFHVEVGLDEAPAKFRTALHTTLRSADRQDLRSIAFPGLALCPDEFLSSFMEVVYEFEEYENPRCLRLIRTAIPAERAVEMIQMTKYIDISKQKMENSYFHNNRDQQDERASLEDTDELSKLRDIPGTFTSFTNKHHAVAAEIESYPLQTLTLKQDRSTGTDTLAKEESNCVSEQTTAISSSTFDETGRISHESSFTPMSFSDDINAASASTDATNNIPLIQPNTTAKEEERIIMDAFGRHVRIQIQQGDIINEDTEALVRFIYPGADDVDGLLAAAGDLVRQEYAQEKAKGGLYVNRGVVCTSAGNIGQNKRLFHVEVRLDEGPGTMAKFRTALHTTLRSADRQDLRSIAFPALALHTYRVEILKAYMEVVYEFEDCENPRCLWLIRTVLPAKKAVAAQMDVAVRQKIIERMEKYVEISKDKMKEITLSRINIKQVHGSVPLVDTDEQSELYDKNLSEEFEIDSHPLQTVTWNQDHRPGTGIHQDRSPRTDTHATEENYAISEQTTTISSSFDETDRISLESSSTPVASSDNINTASSLIQPKTTSQTGVRRRVKAEVQGAIKAGTPVRDLQSDDKEDDKLRSRDEQIRDLCLAAAAGDYDTCKSLLQKGIDVNCSHMFVFDFTPLHEASSNGHSAVCQILLRAGAIVNNRAGPELDERTPLHQAAMSGHDKVCKVLLDNGAVVNAITKQGHEVTPLWLAAKNGHGTVCQVLLQAGAKINCRIGLEEAYETTPLHEAAMNGHDTVCKVLLDAGAEVNVRSKEGHELTPLCLAAQNGHGTVCQMLLQAGAIVNVRAGLEAYETTPLHEATVNGHDNVCKVLLDVGAEVNVRTKVGHEVTPLWLAAQNGHGTVCQVLLQAGAIADNRAGVQMDETTPLHKAAQSGSDNICKKLLDAGAKVNAKTRKGQEVTPFWLAAQDGHDVVGHILLGGGANVNARAGVQMGEGIALHQAAKYGHDNFCKLLLDAGANVNAKTRSGQEITPLMTASQHGHGIVCQSLLKAGAIVNARAGVERFRKTALHEAAQNGHDNVCKILLDAGANANATTMIRQHTPLHLAVINSELKNQIRELDEDSCKRYGTVFRLLVDAGADPGILPVSHIKSKYCKEYSATLDHKSTIVEVPDVRVRLEVPEGAIPVAETVEVTISVHMNGKHHPPLENNHFVIGPTVCIEPHNTTFLKPVVLVLPHSAQNITARNVTVWSKIHEASKWHIIFDGADESDASESATVRVTEGQLKIRVTHFSWFTSILSYFTGSQQTMQMEMRPFMHHHYREERMIRVLVYALREDQKESLKTEEAEVNGVQCGEMTPFVLHLNGENVSCRIQNEKIYPENKWELVEEQKDILYEQLQEGRYAKCTFTVKKTDDDVKEIHGLISADQADRKLFEDSTFANTMCIFRRPDNQADNIHRPMSRLQLSGNNQPRSPDSQVTDSCATSATLQPSASQQRSPNRQSQQSTPGNYMAPTTASQDRGAIYLSSDNSKKGATASGFPNSAYRADELRSMEPQQRSQGDLECEPNNQSHLDLTEEHLLQSLQPFKIREKGDLTNAFLEMVARRIQSQWRGLAAKLGFTDDDCDEFEGGDNIAGPYWPAFIMLDRLRANFSETEVRNGKTILADAIQPLDENLYDKIVNWDMR